MQSFKRRGLSTQVIWRRSLQLTANDVELRQSTVWSWLHLASRDGYFEIVKFLVENGTDVNVRHSGGVAIHRAVSYGHLEIARYLHAHGAVFDTHDPAKNLLFSAITNSHVEIAQWLLAVGFDPHIIYRSVTGKLKNALSYAQQREESEIVDLLLAAGCRLPDENTDVGVNEADVQIPEPSSADRLRDEIVEFVAQQYGPVDKLAIQEILPVLGDVSVAISVIRPNEQRHDMTLFTTGVSDEALNVPDRQGGVSVCRVGDAPASDVASSQRCVVRRRSFMACSVLAKSSLLAAHHGVVARSTSNHHFIGDEPLDPNVKHTCLLLLADRIPPLDSKEGKQIRFYTVVPLYAEERDFATQHGLDVLVERLTDRGLLVFDPERENVGVQ